MGWETQLEFIESSEGSAALVDVALRIANIKLALDAGLKMPSYAESGIIELLPEKEGNLKRGTNDVYTPKR